MTTFICSPSLRVRTLGWLAAVAFMALSVDASGQTVTQWQRGGLLGGFVGAGSTSSETRAAAGTTLGWELLPHFTIEGRGAWFRRPDNVPADFTAQIGAQIPLLPRAAVVPYVLGGVGMYRATVEPGSDVPAFYLDRMPAGSAREIFQDVTLVFGGGADVFLTSHIAIRPEVTFPVIMSGSDHLTKAIWGVHVAYHFEEHGTP